MNTMCVLVYNRVIHRQLGKSETYLGLSGKIRVLPRAAGLMSLVPALKLPVSVVSYNTLLCFPRVHNRPWFQLLYQIISNDCHILEALCFPRDQM